MEIPKFTAEACAYRSDAHYRSVAVSGGPARAGEVMPARMIMCGSGDGETRCCVWPDSDRGRFCCAGPTGGGKFTCGYD
jgi:hypothetical protein